MDGFEYRVCQAQQSRVTFVNGRWTGSIPNTSENPQAAFLSCPEVWAFLDQAGAEGWDLVSVTSRIQDEGQVVDVLYLRRRV